MTNWLIASGGALGFDTNKMAQSAQGFEFSASSVSVLVLAVLGLGALIAAGVVGLKAFERASDLAGDERRRAAGKEALPYLLVAGGVIFAAFVMFFMINAFLGL